MRTVLRRQAARAVAAVGTLTGKRFGLLVASSVVATSAIVAGALTGGGDGGALAALLGRSLAAGSAPAQVQVAEPRSAAEPGPAPSRGGAPAPAAEPPAAPLPAPAPPPARASEPAREKTPPVPEEETFEAGPVKHVFVISLTSPGYESSFGAQSQMPYLLGALRPQGELLSGYALLGAGPLVNGVAAVSGQPPNPATGAGCPQYGEIAGAKASPSGVLSGTGCVYPVETLTLADQLVLARQGWRAYAAGMSDETGPAQCVHPEPGGSSAAAEPGGYAATQNPFVFFHSLLDLGECSANDVPLEQLPKDLGKAEKTPNYAFIAPTPCESGAAGECPQGAVEGAAAADAFLAAWVPKILASPAYESGGLLAIVFSAVNPASPGEAPAGEALRTGALLLSPFLRPGSTDSAPYGPYSLLRSVEDLFGLAPLARAGAAGTRSFAPALQATDGGD